MHQEIEKTYQKKTQLEHILLRPDTYIGSVEHQTQQLWVSLCFFFFLISLLYKPTKFIIIQAWVHQHDLFHNNKCLYSLN